MRYIQVAVILFFASLFSSSCLAIGPYTNNGDTIDDQATGLTWMRKTADTNNNGSIGSDDTLNWQNALAYCEGLTLSGYSDWRVPNIRDLKSLVNHRAILSSVLDPVFQCQTGYGTSYWSSTTSGTGQRNYARVITFSNGVPDVQDKLNNRYVRCVRGGVSVPKIDINITSDKDIVSSGIENFGFKVVVKNIGTSNLAGIPVTIEHATAFASPNWNCLDEEKSENAVCNKITTSATRTTFSADIPAGGFVTINGTGNITAIPVVVNVTALGFVKSVIRDSLPPSDLPGTQDVKLCAFRNDKKITVCCDNDNCTADFLGIDSSKDTIVLTHGLQDSNCNHEDLWTGFKSDPAQAGYLLNEKYNGVNEKYNGGVNVLQFFWKGACQEHGLFGAPTKEAYENARKNVFYAGRRLAELLSKTLSAEEPYSKKIHFIGHSLGTAVTAHAASFFLRKENNIKNAQVTILDYPSTERAHKLLGFGNNWKKGESWGKEQGFDKNFFASTLPSNHDRPDLFLLVDNYFSLKKESLDDVRSFGVGMPINGSSSYNHPAIEDPGLMGKFFFPNKEGTANDHSGVHQWYRWTIRPNKDENFENESVCVSATWNNLPLVLIDITTYQPVSITDECCWLCKCEELGKIQSSLSPCAGGWYYSIIGGGASPAPNGKSVNKTSLFTIEPSNMTSSGCDVRLDGSYICTCKENSTTSSSLLKTATFAATSEAPTPERFYAELDINVPEFVRYISFDYTFTNTGDGDYVYLFAEGKSIWLTSGTAAQQGQKISSGLIPLRMTAGPNKLVIALYGVGEKNAEFKIENLKFTTIADTDGDGYGDDDDEFPDDDKEWEDTDKDGIGDNDDAFPLDPKENADTDGDGIGDYADTDDNMYADLAVISRSLDKTGLAPGEDFNGWAAVKNKGTARATAAPVRYYLSTDSTISTSDTLLGSRTSPVLNPGSTSWVHADLRAPNEPGTYWFGSCVDAVNGDSNETNNCSFGFKITVATQLPDLALSSLNAPYQVETGERFNITFEVKNEGTLASVPTTAVVRYVDTATLTSLDPIREESIPALAVNQTISRSPSIKAPCKAGEYWISVCVNSGENIERGGNNNCYLKYLFVNQGDGVCVEGEEKSSIFPAIDLLLK